MTREPDIGGDSQLAEPDAAGLGTNSLLKGTPLARAASLLSYPPLSWPALSRARHRSSVLRALRLHSQLLVDVEVRARLSSVSDVCEHERQALEGMDDPRLEGVLLAISRLQAEIIAALATLGPPPSNGR